MWEKKQHIPLAAAIAPLYPGTTPAMGHSLELQHRPTGPERNNRTRKRTNYEQKKLQKGLDFGDKVWYNVTVGRGRAANPNPHRPNRDSLPVGCTYSTAYDIHGTA